MRRTLDFTYLVKMLLLVRKVNGSHISVASPIADYTSMSTQFKVSDDTRKLEICSVNFSRTITSVSSILAILQLTTAVTLL